ncbi:hypothetical protein C9J03_05905 [Photobacterium gaetbulicola]|uniref:Uncharacterized protein n=1 Tax=Photobacterium gaetbulicola Gung47 TaxID=658445 RepID=A0A0C5WRC8_9GAMM|nr:hypothetical protein [Photobacterium gaetbulicola]AJR08897.1 hypothetical protein H744_2c2234 [Photobacterium gaetbulicola Gung47]PSU13452.1 hypothetical protein C9J03_05905 [Photobacterium gaetbulicola]
MTQVKPLSTLTLTQSHNWLSEEQEAQLLGLIAHCFKGVEPNAYFNKYFLGTDAYERKLKLFYQPFPDIARHKSNGVIGNEDDNGKVRLVGYCLLTFQKTDVEGKETIIIGASAGFLPDQRHGNQTVTFSLLEAAKCYMRHPLTPVYYADTMISPAMYRVMAKFLPELYPKANTQLTEPASRILDYLQQTVMIREPDWHPHLCYVQRSVDYGEQEIASFQRSTKRDIQYYLSINPNFSEGYGIVTIIPVNIKNILGSGMKFLTGR